MDIHKLNKILKLDALIATLMVFALLLISPIIFSISFFQPFYRAFSDLETTDYQYAEIRNESTLVDTSIVIINLQDTTNVQLALLLNNLTQYNVQAIGIYEIIKKSSNNEINELLKELLLKNKDKLVLSATFKNFSTEKKEFESITLPAKGLLTKEELKEMNIGFTNFFLDKDGIEENLTVRRFFPYYSFDGKVYRSFGTEILRKIAPEKEKILKARNNQFETINYIGNVEKFVFLEFEQALELDSNFYQGKIVLIGEAPAYESIKPLKKMNFTPMNEYAGGRTFPDMFPIIIQANILSMLIHQNYYEKLPQWLTTLITFLLCYFNMIFFFYISDRHRVWFELATMIVFVVESILILYLTIVLFHKNNFELNLTISIFVIALSLPVSELYYQFLKPIIQKFYIIQQRR